MVIRALGNILFIYQDLAHPSIFLSNPQDTGEQDYHHTPCISPLLRLLNSRALFDATPEIAMFIGEARVSNAEYIGPSLGSEIVPLLLRTVAL